jgi:hypothetical protein
MNRAGGNQAIKAHASKHDLPFFGGADFLAASGGLALSFFWGFFAATFFCRDRCFAFAGCDCLFAAHVAAHGGGHRRRRFRRSRSVLLGARESSKSQHRGQKSSLHHRMDVRAVEAGYQKNGMAAVYLGPMWGTPYKLYAVEAPRFFRATPFLLTTIPARGWRFVLVRLSAAACAPILSRRWNKSARELTILHALAWTLFYILIGQESG